MPAQIDPTIALQVRPQQDYGQMLSNVLTLKNAGQQSQLNAIKLQQAGQDYQDEQANRAAVTANTATGPDGTPTLNRAGYLGQIAKTAPGQYLPQSQKFAQQDIANAKAKADSDKVTLENLKAHTDYVASHLQGILSQPTPELQQKAYTSSLAQMTNDGVIKPGEFPAVLDPNLVQQQLARTLSQKDIIDQKQKDADLAEKTQNDAAERTQAATRDLAATNDRAAERKIQQQNANTESGRLALQQKTQGTADSQAIETQAQQIANGDVKALSQARQNPLARAVMARVYEINPKYSDSLYSMTQALRSDKPNSMGANVGRLGTAVLHADSALNNSNKLGFSEGLLTGVGTAGTAAYKQDAEFLTGEIGQFVTGGKLTVDEGNKISKDLMSSRQGVRDSALHQILDLSGGKLKSQMEQFKNATQTDFPTERVFNDPAISGALQKHGIIGRSSQGGAMIRATDLQGVVHQAPAGTPLPAGWKAQ